jgi:ABC-type amino acid transport substrate-binding protein
MGADPIVVHGGPSARLMEELRSGNIDVVSASFWDMEHAGFAAFSTPYDADEITAFVPSNKTFDLLSMADLRGRRGVAELGVGYGEAFNRYAETYLRLERVVAGRLIEMVAKGRVDYAVLPRTDGLRKIDETGLSNSVQALPGIISVVAVQMMVSRRSPCIAQLDKLNATLRQMQKDHVVLSVLETYSPIVPAAGQ